MKNNTLGDFKGKPLKVTIEEILEEMKMIIQCGNDFCNDPDIQDVSVSSSTATFSINSNDRLSPDTNYIASISSSIQDEDGNFLDCFGSKGWMIIVNGIFPLRLLSLNPTSGTVLPVTSVTVTGNGFAPISSVVITFEGSTVLQ